MAVSVSVEMALVRMSWLALVFANRIPTFFLAF
jgi:hypothetical protein